MSLNMKIQRMHSSYISPDLDAIARNLTALDLAHLTPEEAADYEQELSAIASLNEALDITADVLRTAHPPDCWQRLLPMLSDAAALLTSQLAPLLDTSTPNAAFLSQSAPSKGRLPSLPIHSISLFLFPAIDPRMRCGTPDAHPLPGYPYLFT